MKKVYLSFETLKKLAEELPTEADYRGYAVSPNKYIKNELFSLSKRLGTLFSAPSIIDFESDYIETALSNKEIEKLYNIMDNYNKPTKLKDLLIKDLKDYADVETILEVIKGVNKNGK